MKKYIFIFTLIILLAIASGCSINYNEYPSFQTKPKHDFYTNSLTSLLSKEDDFQVMLLETNYSTEMDVNTIGKDTLKEFFKSLSENSFITDNAILKSLPKKPIYRLYINKEDEKYVINIFSEDIATLHPWDGLFPEDYINMKESPKAYNLYGLCNYLLKNR
ncbi:MAG: DUF4883 family protein [Clostridiaceae bacterium]